MDVGFLYPSEHHEQHWISDGNIVLSATTQDTTRTILFRVHKSILSDQSDVFATMFGLPQGQGDGDIEMYDGLPLVRLPDAAEEVEALLNALRDPLLFCETTQSSDTPIRIRDALHLASKYMMADLRAKLVRIVEREWPLTVADMEVRTQLFLDLMHNSRGGASHGVCTVNAWPVNLVPEPAAAVMLAEEFGIKSIMPAAYYELSRCSPTRVWGSFDATKYSDKPARWSCLSAKALLKLYRLQTFMVGLTNERFKHLSRKLVVSCSFPISEDTDNECRVPWVEIVKDEGTIATSVQDRDIVMQLRAVRMRLLGSESGMCVNCNKVLFKVLNTMSNDVWGEIQNFCWSDVDSN